MDYCQAGHKSHEKRMQPSIQGDVLIYAYEQYMGFAGYCQGQDDISQTITLYGNWSHEMFDFISRILDGSKRGGLFIDVGSHIGWFSRLALSKGFDVFGYEGVSENIELATVNAPDATFTKMWFDENTKPSELIYESDLIKIDVEGMEQHAVRFFEKSFHTRNIRNAVMEISPVFNDSYPALVERMKNWGYEVLLLNGAPFDGNFDFPQTDLWFKLK